jgi:hypothetical protein
MLRTTLAATAFTLAASSAFAITIDNFDITAADEGGGFVGASVSVSDGAGLGTSRTLSATVDAIEMGTPGRLGVFSNEVFFGTPTSRFELTTGSTVHASATLEYSGLGGIDLGDIFHLSQVANDAGFSLTVSITDTLSNTLSTSTNLMAGMTMQDVSVDISSLAAVAGDADVLTIILESQAFGGDISFAEISTKVAPVPLPAAGVLLIAGLGAIAAVRRRAA